MALFSDFFFSQRSWVASHPAWPDLRWASLFRRMAAPDHADPDDGADHRLQLFDAGLRRLEVAALAELAERGALHHRRHDRRSDRDRAAHVYRPGLHAQRGGFAADHLRRLWSGAAGVQAVARRRRGRWRRRISERDIVRTDRTARVHHHRLVSVARLDQGRAARGLSARHARGQRRHRNRTGFHRRHHRGNWQAVCCSAFPRCWAACGWGSSCTESSTTSHSAR